MPVKYSEKLFNEILDRIMEGETLFKICNKDRDKDRIPDRSTFNKWVSNNEELAELYGIALDLRDEVMFDEIIEIADDVKRLETTESIQRDKLRIDTRKWVLGRRKPKKYGERSQRNEDDDEGGGIHQKTTEYYPDV